MHKSRPPRLQDGHSGSPSCPLIGDADLTLSCRVPGSAPCTLSCHRPADTRRMWSHGPYEWSSHRTRGPPRTWVSYVISRPPFSSSLPHKPLWGQHLVPRGESVQQSSLPVPCPHLQTRRPNARSPSCARWGPGPSESCPSGSPADS